MRRYTVWAVGVLIGCSQKPESIPLPQPTSGAQIYAKLCASCHAPDGRSLATIAPPLAAHAVRILEAGGRGHLIRIVLNGMAGPIEVQGRRYDAMMTPLRYLNDQQVADVLNHVLSSWGNEKLLPPDHRAFTPDEVAKERVPIASPREMAAHRPPLPKSSEETLKK